MSPTSARSMIYSIINIPQSIGIIAAPYLRHIDIGPEFTKYVAVGILCIVAGAFCIFLPETKDLPLPADIKTASDNFTIDMRDREELMRWGLLLILYRANVAMISFFSDQEFWADTPVVFKED
ncbi:hypothetical protein OESDEN_17009 [Oesophagostomum dentatum]|uniref:Major facilitator superfamily (MFS) profile domain-containing protein n=1 Tax=Oesophagostomum dentatum TaxID=61180 RepID=A0A0B1SJA5_OESDE|nr:hypothetical protein OESDEN_17009 [Oesophagostomum dentatum]